ncbi:DNA-binding transcriptional regulator, AcrR family [Amycolatopsis xylanica]|uniref:DNA-binding transcriptional regulator, AcrR family n=1 Tax=Amycolatopsis xylanica TaxID=589385 RepID=A0A1H3SQW3_9PSEU|nr:TetR/AcrR family transcriptional regulator [Amycolatopsis xylanica]SDZ40396.1 DNA-binding transcriptional regulator, AcrR family [Amycolatopsis xylanica]
MPGSVNRHRTDARTERWREHKLALRREFVDAAFRALAKQGPEVSMDEIAAEAGTVKPKLYRHFAAKSDLAGAVSERMGEILWQRLLPNMNLRDAPRVTIRRGLEAYVNVVDEYPNVFKFLMRTDSEPLMESGKEIAGVIANVLKEFLSAADLDPELADPSAYAVVGAVGAAAEWWMRTRTMSKDKFVTHLTTMTWGALDAVLREQGIALDPDRAVEL